MLLKRIITIATILISCNIYAGRTLLTEQCDIEEIPQMFIEGHAWVDFPNYSDRGFWGAVSPKLKSIIIKNGDEELGRQAISLTGYDYLLFKQGQTYDVVSQKLLAKKSRLENFMLAELVEGKGRFLDEICSSVWDLCALGNWTGPESQYLQTGELGLPSFDKVVVDELTGEIAGVLAWSYYMFEEELNKVDPNITKWLISSIRTKFLQPSLEKYDFYWMCYQTNKVAIQTPWISYNWLLSNLLIEKDNSKRQKSIYKTMECLDHFYKSSPSDGGCTGGSEIWQYTTAKYFESLELLDLVSVGEINNYEDEKLLKMGEFICKNHISDEYVFNYSDCTPRLTLPASLIYRYGKKVGSEVMINHGAYVANSLIDKGKLPIGDFFDMVKLIVNYDEMKALGGAEPLLADTYLEETQVITARSIGGSNEGFFFGVKGGYNNEFGNQNDAGSFVLYVGGQPLLIDPGKTNKTVKSISNQRYSVWANQSSFHNLPTINGYAEEEGANYRVIGLEYNASPNKVKVNMQLQYAYSLDAGIKEWQRSFDFDRKDGLEITDRFELGSIKGDTYISFITLSKPEIKGNGVVQFSIDGSKYEFNYKSSLFDINVETIDTKNDVSLKQWGDEFYRIVLKPRSRTLSGNWIYSFKVI